MTAPDHMSKTFKNCLHETGHPHMGASGKPGRLSQRTGRPSFRSTLNLVNEHALCPLVQIAGAFGGVVHLLLGHVLANFNIALFASASASRRVA